MKEIKAKDGYYLTQSAEDVKNRVFVKSILGENVDKSAWREATKEEKEVYEKEKPSRRTPTRRGR